MKTTLNHLHHQHTDWLRELDFYKIELKVLTERLAEVASANTALPVMQQVEHFQNRFVLLNEQLDVQMHEVKLAEKALQEKVKSMPEHIDQKAIQPNEKLHADVSYLFKNIADTRFEFNGFLAKTL